MDVVSAGSLGRGAMGMGTQMAAAKPHAATVVATTAIRSDETSDGAVACRQNRPDSQLPDEQQQQQHHPPSFARTNSGSSAASGGRHQRRRAQAARRSASMNAAEQTTAAGAGAGQQHGQAPAAGAQPAGPFNRRKNKWQIQRNLAPKLKRQRSFSANYAPVSSCARRAPASRRGFLGRHSAGWPTRRASHCGTDSG
jgi:hypothetical protein